MSSRGIASRQGMRENTKGQRFGSVHPSPLGRRSSCPPVTDAAYFRFMSHPEKGESETDAIPAPAGVGLGRCLANHPGRAGATVGGIGAHSAPARIPREGNRSRSGCGCGMGVQGRLTCSTKEAFRSAPSGGRLVSPGNECVVDRTSPPASGSVNGISKASYKIQGSLKQANNGIWQESGTAKRHSVSAR